MKWLRKTLLAGAFAPLLLLYGCTARTDHSSQLAGTVTACGPSSAYRAATGVLEAFHMENPNVTTTYTNGGSTEGVLGVLYGSLDIAFTSNVVEDLPEGVDAVPFAYDGIAFIIHPDNPVSELTSGQLALIFSGEVTNWRELGGNDEEILLLGQLEMNGIRRAVEGALGGETHSYDGVFSGEGGLRYAVSIQPGAIGYISFSAVNRNVNALAVDGIAPSRAALNDGSYPYKLEYSLVYNSAFAPKDTVQAFIHFFEQADLETLMAASGVQAVG